MRIEASATFIPDPEKMRLEIMELGNIATATQALDIIHKHFVRLQVVELISYEDLANAVFSQVLINQAADRLKQGLADEILNKSGMIHLEKEGEWPE